MSEPARLTGDECWILMARGWTAGDAILARLRSQLAAVGLATERDILEATAAQIAAVLLPGDAYLAPGLLLNLRERVKRGWYLGTPQE